MTTHSIYWHEGQFLCPQHMQLAERLNFDQVCLADKLNLHYNWGLRSLDLDPEALSGNQLVVRSLRARFQDGTPVSVPEDIGLDPLDLGPGLDQANPVTVFLTVPLLQLGKRNAQEPQTGEMAKTPVAPAAGATSGTGGEDEVASAPRFLTDVQDVVDENSGEDPQAIQIRRLNLKLHLGTKKPAGYESLPIGQFTRSDAGLPEVFQPYIPPVVACDAWGPLYAGILQYVYDRVGTMIEKRGARVQNLNIAFDARSPGAPQLLTELRILNEAYAVLRVLAFAEGLHPLPAYLELCRLVGQLAIFREERRVPYLPRYDHDDLGGCFFRLKTYIDELLPQDKPTWEQEPFIGEGLHMKVTMKEKWLDPAWKMFVGVRSPLTTDECAQLLTQKGRLQMKIASAERVDHVWDGGFRGLEFVHARTPDQALPVEPGLVYFQVNRESNKEEWNFVKEKKTLAVRQDINRIVNSVGGKIQGVHKLKLKASDRAVVDMEFTLYLLPPGA
jgi:type VI secretion system protein ImpJ